MPLYTTFLGLSANARFGSIALLVGGLLLSVSAWIDGAASMRLFAFAVLFFGQLCYAQEAGFEKPLTKFVLVWLGMATIGFVMFEVLAAAKAGLLFGFTGLAAVLIWSIAILHRPGRVRVAGRVGALAGIMGVALLIGGHVFVGLGAALGLQVLRSASIAEVSDVIGLTRVVATTLGIWSVVGSWIVFFGHLGVSRSDRTQEPRENRPREV